MKKSYVPGNLRSVVERLDLELRKEIERVYRECRDSRGGRWIATTPPKPGSHRYPYRKAARPERWYRK